MKIKEKLFYILAIYIITSNALMAQEERYYYEDNIFHEIYKRNKVKSCVAINTLGTTEYHFDTEGNLIIEVDLYGTDSLCIDSLFYQYDENHRHTKFSWVSKCPPEVDVTEYEYDEKGRLIKYCDSSTKGLMTRITLDNCIMINYRNGKIAFETNAKGDTLDRFIAVDGKVLVKSKKGELVSVYEDENRIESHYSDLSYYRTFTEKHQLLMAKQVNKQGQLIQTTQYIYKNDLLIQSITYDPDGEIISTIKFKYTYFE